VVLRVATTQPRAICQDEHYIFESRAGSSGAVNVTISTNRIFPVSISPINEDSILDIVIKPFGYTHVESTYSHCQPRNHIAPSLQIHILNRSGRVHKGQLVS
jgi:hypothetical protein